MFILIKRLLRKILPPPVNTFNREVWRILDAIGGTRRSLEKRFAKMEQESREQLAVLTKEKQRLLELLDASNIEKQKLVESLEMLSKENARLQKTVQDIFSVQASISKLTEKILLAQTRTEEKTITVFDKQEQIYKLLQNTKSSIDAGERWAREGVWAEIYNNTVYNSDWLKNKAFSPGRWAVGYPYLYVTYRVLNEFQPKRILELGLGQSTRMIAQYAASHYEVEHYVVEHDQSWIDFFLKDFQLSERTKIIRLDRKMVSYKEAKAVRVFAGFAEVFQGMRFDYISIDAPLGGDMKQYARIDVLHILPDCLEQSFVIMLDDYERSGEQHTAKEMEEILAINQIAFKSGNYSGAKDLRVWCSPDLAFLCSL